MSHFTNPSPLFSKIHSLSSINHNIHRLKTQLHLLPQLNNLLHNSTQFTYQMIRTNRHLQKTYFKLL